MRCAAAASAMLAIVAWRSGRVAQVVRQHAVVREVVRQLESDVAFDRLEPLDVLLARQRDRVSGGAGTCRTAGAMDVVLRIEGQGVVDDGGDTLGVQPA